VRRVPAQLQAEFDAWRSRDLSAVQVCPLFLDGQFHAARSASTEKEGLLAADALCEDGQMVLLHLGLGPRERTDAWVAFLHKLTARGLGERAPARHHGRQPRAPEGGAAGLQWGSRAAVYGP
jgi:transposase-like protein